MDRPAFYDRLSRAAQSWIDGARAEIADLEERLAVAQETVAPGGKTEVRAGLGGYSLDRDLVPLPPRTEIEFATGESCYERLRFRMPVTRDVGWVEVTTGDGAMLIRPGGSNVVYLKVQPWHDSA